MRKLIAVAVIAIVAMVCGACGGSSSGGATGLNNANTVTGTVKSASGDPVPATTVFIPGTTVTASTNASTKATRTYLKVVTAADGTECEDPPAADQSLASACSSADGTFSIDTSSITTNATQIVFQRGSLRMVMDLNCSADPCALDSSVTTFGSSATWPTIAVVTGMYDRMEDVLAKLADDNTSDNVNGQYGRVCDPSTKDSLGCQEGTFVYGSEFGTNLTIVDGLGYTTPVENTGEIGTYTTWDQYFNPTSPLLPLLDGSSNPAYDVVFINCGNSYETVLNDPTNLTLLENYVNAGGRLYVTDLSYDFVNQPFPSFMNFPGDTDKDTPGSIGSAELGTAGLTTEANVNGDDFKSFLRAVQVNNNGITGDGTSPGNPDLDCATDPYSQVTSALLSSDLIPLGEFLSGWAHMIEPWAGVTPAPVIWITANNFDLKAAPNNPDPRPLTVTQDYGSNGGQIIYSSYHTAHSCPTLTFWPQERVMQFLIFGAF